MRALNKIIASFKIIISEKITDMRVLKFQLKSKCSTFFPLKSSLSPNPLETNSINDLEVGLNLKDRELIT